MSGGQPADSHVEPTAFDPDRFASEPGETGPHPGDAVATAPRHYRGCTDHQKQLLGFGFPLSETWRSVRRRSGAFGRQCKLILEKVNALRIPPSCPNPNTASSATESPIPDPKGLRERREEEYLKQAYDSRSRRRCQASGRTRPLGVECRCRPRAAGFLVVSGRGSMAWPSLVSRVFRKVFVFAPGATPIQVFIPTIGSFDRRQLIVEFGDGH